MILYEEEKFYEFRTSYSMWDTKLKYEKLKIDRTFEKLLAKNPRKLSWRPRFRKRNRD